MKAAVLNDGSFHLIASSVMQCGFAVFDFLKNQIPIHHTIYSNKELPFDGS